MTPQLIESLRDGIKAAPCARCGQSLAGSLFRVATVDGERHELCPEPSPRLIESLQAGIKAAQCSQCQMVAGHVDGCPVSPTSMALAVAERGCQALSLQLEEAQRQNERLQDDLAEAQTSIERLHAALLRGAA